MIDLTGPMAVATGASSVALGWAVFGRGRRIDKAVENKQISDSQTGAVGQVIDGLNRVIDAIQTDNEIGRATIREMRVGLTELGARLDDAVRERDACRGELIALKRKYDIAT